MNIFVGKYVAPYRKAITATLLAFLGNLYVSASAEGGFTKITAVEWLAIFLTTFGAGGGTYAMKNAIRRPMPK